MSKSELIELIIASSKSDWTIHFDYNTNITTYIFNKDISILIELEETGPFNSENWTNIFPDKSSQTVEFRIKKDNNLIEKKHFVYTDGRRYLFPLPKIENGIAFFEKEDEALAKIFSDGDLSLYKHAILNNYEQ